MSSLQTMMEQYRSVVDHAIWEVPKVRHSQRRLFAGSDDELTICVGRRTGRCAINDYRGTNHGQPVGIFDRTLHLRLCKGKGRNAQKTDCKRKFSGCRKEMILVFLFHLLVSLVRHLG